MARYRPPAQHTRRQPKEKRIRAILVEAESLLERGDGDEDAKELLARLPEPPWPDPEDHLRAGDCFLTLGDLPAAELHYRAAIAADPGDPDAHHGLGEVLAQREDVAGAAEAWLRTLALDMEEAPMEWALSEGEFAEVAEAAFDELPDEIKARLVNVPILCSLYPPKEIVAEGWDPRLLGFFAGAPYGTGVESGAIDHIELYQRNIERASRSAEEVKEEIRITLIHETGHFFGLDDDDLEARGLG